MAALTAFLFVRWSQWLLLGRRVRWRALLPGAVVTVVGLLGLRLASRLVFSPLIASNMVTYGSFGSVLVIQSWLVGVGVVVLGGAPVGRLLDEELPRVRRALKRRRRGPTHRRGRFVSDTHSTPVCAEGGSPAAGP